MDVLVLLFFAFVVLVLVGHEQRRKLRPKRITTAAAPITHAATKMAF